MSATSFPKSQKATITLSPLNGVIWHEAYLLTSERVNNMTASGDTSAMHMHGIPHRRVRGIGSISSGGYAKAQLSTLTLGSIEVYPTNWSVGISWPPDPLTGSGNSAEIWGWGYPLVTAQVAGWTKDTGPIESTQTETFSGAFNVLGTISGTVKIISKRTGIKRRRGGMIPFSFNCTFHGTVTHTTSSVPSFATESAGDPADPANGSLSLNLDTGQTISSNGLAMQYQVSAPAQIGGPLPLEALFFFDATT